MRKLLEATRKLLPPTKGPEWVQPSASLDGPESVEIKYHHKVLGVPLAKLQGAIRKGKLRVLPTKDWKAMKNSDSWNSSDSELVGAAKRGREPHRVLQAFDKQSRIPAPTIIYRKGKRPYLLGGNTRLTVSYIRGIRPKIWKVRLKPSKQRPGGRNR